MTIEDITSLKDGTRVVLTQTGNEWGDDKGSSGVCVKIGNRLVEADIKRPNDSSQWYPYYSINELNDKGYECEVSIDINEFVYDICKIIFEGESTDIGRRITIDRIKDIVNYDSWLGQ